MKNTFLILSLVFGLNLTAQEFKVDIILNDQVFPQKIIQKYKDCLILIERRHFNQFLNVYSERFTSKSNKSKLQNMRKAMDKVFDTESELWVEKDIPSSHQAFFSLIYGDYFIEHVASGFIKVCEYDLEKPVYRLATDSKKEAGDGHGGGLDTHEKVTTYYTTPSGLEVYHYSIIRPVKK